MLLSGAPINTTHFPAGSTHPAIPAQVAARSPDREQLRALFPSTAALLYRRRADLIGDDMIERYVALQWLQWNGGALKLTVTGQNVCNQFDALAADGKSVE